MAPIMKVLVQLIGLFSCVLLVLRPANSLTSSSIPKCTKKFCQDYRDDPGCPNVSNCTGILLPSPTKCNCCQYCLNYIEEGGECSSGIPGQASSQEICGPRLTCNDNVCTKMSTKCMNETALFEEKWKNGTLGGNEIEPMCDDHGDYGPIKCIPGSICFCSSPTGERIFGEMINMYSDMSDRMDCACSRDEWKARNRIKKVAPALLSKTKSIFVRCVPSGSYGILQCVKDRCTCVDNKGIPQPPDAGKPVEYIYMSHIRNGKPWCFNLTNYQPGSFDTPCLKHRGEILDMVKELEKNVDSGVVSTVLGLENVMPSCDPDGSYSPIQKSWEMKFCVDPDGNELLGPDGNYSVPLDSPAASNMNCRCARTVFLLEQWNLKVAAPNKKGNPLPPLLVTIPKCCKNGNFEVWQCVNGFCHCVDSDGAQISPDVSRIDVKNLPCYNSNDRCQA